jgi:hypothetical protein
MLLLLGCFTTALLPQNPSAPRRPESIPARGRSRTKRRSGGTPGQGSITDVLLLAVNNKRETDGTEDGERDKIEPVV